MASVEEIWSVTYRHHRAGHERNNVAVSFIVAYRAFVDPSKLAVYDGERSACTNNASECTKPRGGAGAKSCTLNSTLSTAAPRSINVSAA